MISKMLHCGLVLGIAVGVTMRLARSAEPDSHAAVAVSASESSLPEHGIYPHGRKLAFLGYSGDPARDLANGFTVAGPVYGDQKPYLERCFANGWPVVAHVGPRITFNDKDPAKYKVDPPILRQEIQKQVRELASHKEIVWWTIHPEELRPWRGDEMRYLAIVCEAVRATDPLARPIYLYNPNHRDVKTLLPIAKQVDIVAKGCYVNTVGRKRDRAWVRWSVEQETEALRAGGRAQAIPLLMPELCKDPEPEEDKEIRAWVRHDVYLGLASGAKGVLIWSLFKRREVKRTWQLWYDAYSECARELNGPRGLAQVFLFGERQSTLKVQQVQGSAAANVTLGGSAEAGATTEQERAQREVKFPSWTSAEFLYRGSRWLFLVNSANAPAAFTVNDSPPGSGGEDAFTGKSLGDGGDRSRRFDLGAYGVVGLRFPLTEPAEQNR